MELTILATAGEEKTQTAGMHKLTVKKRCLYPIFSIPGYGVSQGSEMNSKLVGAPGFQGGFYQV